MKSNKPFSSSGYLDFLRDLTYVDVEVSYSLIIFNLFFFTFEIVYSPLNSSLNSAKVPELGVFLLIN